MLKYLRCGNEMIHGAAFVPEPSYKTSYSSFSRNMCVEFFPDRSLHE